MAGYHQYGATAERDAHLPRAYKSRRPTSDRDASLPRAYKAQDFRPTKERRDSSLPQAYKSNDRRVLNNVSNRMPVDKNSDGTVSGMTCTSGLTNLGLELQEKFRRRRSKSKKKEKPTNKREDGLPEIEEEYDIQTIVSGLTRNSEFPEFRDPPDQVNDSTEWPDDETNGQRCSHLISVLEGDQVMSKDTIRSRREKRISRRGQENSIVLPELKESTSETSNEQKTTLNENKTPGKDPNPCIDNLLSPEPDGTKFRNNSQKVAIEPAGTKIESLIMGCASKNESPRKFMSGKSRRGDPFVLMNEDDVEMVYQEKDQDFSAKIEGIFSRRRSRSTSRRAREIGKESEKQQDSKADDAKRRSRSLPRTLKRITSRNRKETEETKPDPSPMKKPPPSTETHYSDPSFLLEPSFIEDIFSPTENKTVSTLGSRCHGIESPTSNRNSCQGVSANYSNHKFSSSEMKSEDSEPRVCVDFDERHSGGQFRTTTVPDQKYRGERKSFSNNRNIDKIQFDTISKKASRNLLLSSNGEGNLFPDTENRFGKDRPSHSRVQSNVAAEGVKASRSSVYATPTSKREARREFSGHQPSDLVPLSHSGRKDLIQRYLALREKHSRVETASSGVQSKGSPVYNREINKSPVHTSSATNSNGRKSERKGGYDDASTHYQIGYDDASTHYRNGYDDASIHYQSPDSEKVATRGSSERTIDQRVSSYPQQRDGLSKLTSSGSKTRLRRSNSEGQGMGGRKKSLINMPSVYKQQIGDTESWRSPTMVSSFPYAQQDKFSYSYASEEESYSPNMFEGKSKLQSLYNFSEKSNYEQELMPHNQFMKTQMGFGN